MQLFTLVVPKSETQIIAGLFDKAPVESHLHPGDGGKRSTCEVIGKSHVLGFYEQKSAKDTISEQMSQPGENSST